MLLQIKNITTHVGIQFRKRACLTIVLSMNVIYLIRQNSKYLCVIIIRYLFSFFFLISVLFCLVNVILPKASHLKYFDISH